jgi:hypothetical protein
MRYQLLCHHYRRCFYLPVFLALVWLLGQWAVLHQSSTIVDPLHATLVSFLPPKLSNVSSVTVAHDKALPQHRPPPPRNLTLIVSPTRGELGNHLHSIAHGLRIKHWVESQYPHLTVLLQLEHNDDYKWFSVAQTLSKCFPILRDNMEIWQGGMWMAEPIISNSTRRERERQYQRLLKYSDGQTQHRLSTLRTQDYLRSRYGEMATAQESWLLANGYNNMTLQMDTCEAGENSMSPSCWHRKISIVLRMHQEQENGGSELFLKPEPRYLAPDAPLKYVSLPFIRTKAWSFGKRFDDPLYHMVRHWFVMNISDPVCCLPSEQLPYPDEIVWHYCNYRREKIELELQGMQEVSPAQFLGLLMQADVHSTTRPPQKIAMLSRFPIDLQPFVDVLDHSPHNFEVRVIRNETGAAAFCFLQQTKHLLIASRLSSFASWTTILTNSNVVLYDVNSTITRHHATRLNKTFKQFIHRGWIYHLPRVRVVIVSEILTNSTDSSS